jgi:hypothetical protein
VDEGRDHRQLGEEAIGVDLIESSRVRQALKASQRFVEIR